MRPVRHNLCICLRIALPDGSEERISETGIGCDDMGENVAAWMTFWHTVAPTEERFPLEKYGRVYREYMNGIPRWIGMPKSEDGDG